MIAIIEYNAGNVRSVENALKRLGAEALITNDPELIRSAEKVIFPGVGEAATAMRYLRENRLDTLIPTLQQPVLGICLGLQLLCASSEEGDTLCLGIFPNQVKKFQGNLPVPHMGWNTVDCTAGPLFTDIPATGDFYFVHSYYAELGKATAAECTYIQPFSAALQKGNFYATQFHPEKSSGTGALLLQNFLNL